MSKEEKNTNKGGRYGLKARDLCQIAVATAIVCVCAWIAFPFGVLPITLQTFAVSFISALLGFKKSLFSLLAYLLLGAVGAPVFAGFNGGVSHLLSPAGGFLMGFLCVPFFAPFMKKSLLSNILFAFLGVIFCYVVGVVWLLFWTENGLWSLLSVCVLPFLPFEMIKICLSAFLARRLQDTIKA